jgi:hypothetical protein
LNYALCDFMTQWEDSGGGLQASGVRVADVCAGDDGALVTVNSLANADSMQI